MVQTEVLVAVVQTLMEPVLAAQVIHQAHHHRKVITVDQVTSQEEAVVVVALGVLVLPVPQQ
jgi:multisubunit Na+/H+ antiporter MnhG subunit